MTNEQQKAKELAELLNAFADGKELLYKNSNGNWERFNGKTIGDVSKLSDRLRIKPEIKRVSLTEQDLIERRKLGFEYMWVKNIESLGEHFITDIMIDGVRVNTKFYNYANLARSFVWLIDGSPCHKEVEYE